MKPTAILLALALPPLASFADLKTENPHLSTTSADATGRLSSFALTPAGKATYSFSVHAPTTHVRNPYVRFWACYENPANHARGFLFYCRWRSDGDSSSVPIRTVASVHGADTLSPDTIAALSGSRIIAVHAELLSLTTVLDCYDHPATNTLKSINLKPGWWLK